MLHNLKIESATAYHIPYPSNPPLSSPLFQREGARRRVKDKFATFFVEFPPQKSQNATNLVRFATSLVEIAPPFDFIKCEFLSETI
jgi:hypothetical protein